IRYSADHILDYIELDGDHAIFEVQIPRDWIGQTVGQIDIRKKYHINILAVKREQKLELTVTSNTALEEETSLLVLGEYKDVQKCFHL
ncbi:MAG: TrkA family potassium uptake protein, partial [Oscillospiraceae bacterium]|nr:TrkA family potassium uptake protein [Oscillospiraceae bacterium]